MKYKQIKNIEDLVPGNLYRFQSISSLGTTEYYFVLVEHTVHMIHNNMTYHQIVIIKNNLYEKIFFIGDKVPHISEVID